VSNPNNPQHAGQIKNGDGGAMLKTPTGLYVSGDYAYVTSNGEIFGSPSGSNALEIVNISDPTNPRHVGSITGMRGADAVVVSGDYAYVANDEGGNMSVINVSDKANPVFVKSYAVTQAYSISINGNYVYLTKRNGGTDAIVIYNISDPADPVFTGGITDSNLGYPLYASVNGNYIFSNNWNFPGSLQATNITDKSAPVLASSLDFGADGGAWSVETNGDYAYLPLYSDSTVLVVNISNPAAMSIVDRIHNGEGGVVLGNPVCIKVSGNYAYVANRESLEVLDISDPAHPVHYGHLALNTKNIFDEYKIAVLKDNRQRQGETVGDDPVVKIAAAVSMPAGDYPFDVTVSDGVNAPVTKTCHISIHSNAFVVYPVANQKALVGHNLSFSIYAVSSKKDYSAMDFTFTANPAANAPAFSCQYPLTITKDGRVQCNLSFNSPDVYDGVITVTAANGSDQFTPQSFKLNIYNNPPVINPLNCAKTIRVGYLYPNCKITAKDPDGHSISSYQLIGSLPPGFNFGNDGNFYGFPSAVGTYSVSFTATDQYGGVSQPVKLTFQVNDYCGDGNKESPNTENKGGPKSDGYEDCDGLSGLPAPNQSSESLQYGCDDKCTSLLDGYCGDYLVQDGLLGTKGKEVTNGLTIFHAKKNYGEQCDFGGDINCCASCLWTTLPYENVALTPPQTADLTQEQIFKFSAPPNRGVNSVSFTANPHVVPQYYTGYPIALVIASDISNPPNSDPLNGTISNMIGAMNDMVDRFSAWSIVHQDDVFIGAFGFGSSTPNTNGSPIHFLINPVNVADNLQASGLKASFGYYDTSMNGRAAGSGADDGPGARAYIDMAIPQAQAMLDAEPDNYLKYMIILTDGCSCNVDSDTTIAANAVKNDPKGIKIYTVAYSANQKTQLCGWSSDKGNASACYNDNVPHFAYESNSNASNMSSILASIQADIISRMPEQFSITASVSGANGSADSGAVSTLPGVPVAVNINLAPIFNCGLDGVNCNRDITLSSAITGSGDVEISNVQFSLMPACQQP
jgi:hypothetical protein